MIYVNRILLFIFSESGGKFINKKYNLKVNNESRIYTILRIS